jgi:hypothetical protein
MSSARWVEAEAAGAAKEADRLSVTTAVYAKARAEIIALFRWDASSLSPDQMLRLDCAVALRLALDDLQGRLIRGEPIDMNRMLTASEALSRLLPPAVLATPPPERREDPRQHMWATYVDARHRGQIPPEGTLQAKINEQAAEIERLKGELAGTEHDDVPEFVESVPAPAAANVVPLKPPSATAPAANPPRYDYDRQSDWKNWVNDDGSVRTTPRGGGHDWGPV